MISYKNRDLDPSIKVEVYRNLHDSTGFRKYSIRQNGLVIGHSCLIYMKGVKFVVRQKGREKVIKEKRKNVHAFMRGYIATGIDDIWDWPSVLSLPPATAIFTDKVSYNPYINNTFVRINGEPISETVGAMLNDNGVWTYCTS